MQYFKPLRRMFGVGVLTFPVLFFTSCQFAPKATKSPSFTIHKPQILVKNVRSDYIITPHFDHNSSEIVFNGRLPGDAYDAIYSISVSGGTPRKLFGTNESAASPAFSNNRERLVFTLGETSQICVLDLVSGSLQRLPVFGTSPSFLPNNQAILFTALMDANLCIYDIVNKQLRPLTLSKVTGNISPLLHPDQTRIIFLENLSQPFQRLASITIDSIKYSILRQIPKSLASITLSPSGEWAIGNRLNGDPRAYALFNPTLQEVPIQIEPIQPHTKLLAHSLTWSPKGDQVAFVGNSANYFSTSNPFIRSGKYFGNIVIAQLKWNNIESASILQIPAVKGVIWFPPVSTASQPPVSQFRPQIFNNTPQIISEPTKVAYQGEIYVYQPEAVEIDLQDDLQYTLLYGPPEAEIMSHTGTIIWTPGDTGSYNFSLRVQDSRFAEDVQEFSVRVLPNPKWNQAHFRPKTSKTPTTDYSASLRFLDANGDGFLSVGETAAIQIDLKPLNSSVGDSVLLVMSLSATIDEVEIQREVTFTKCQPGRWNRQIVPITGLPALRNRPIIIQGILHSVKGLHELPARLVINGQHPDAKTYGVIGTF
jgi:hypothetical protein